MAAGADVRCAVLALLVLDLLATGGDATAGFIKSPLSQRRLTQDSVELHCEAVGNPIPEIQWWFEGNEPNETSAQLWDGAWQDRVKINATYNLHSTSTIYIANLTSDDSGTYECRASNDPDRNHLSKSPKVKWIRSQANVLVIERPVITGQYASSADKVVLSCNMSAPHAPIRGHKWMLGDKTLKAEEGNSDSFITYTIEGKVEEHSGVYECIYETNPVAKGNVSIEVQPQVVAYKKSEHGNEGDTGVLTCKSLSYPPVGNWFWFRSDQTPVVNGTDRYIIKSNGNKTELRILKLSIEQDTGDYHCNGTNMLGPGSATVNLRVRSRLAALWPFLGIVAEVLVLVTIIFIYEKRRKPDEVLDDDDGGSAPLKSNATNHKDKNVRQRNAN
ncbi:basigin isoform X2 [Tympanuchus pallidicinctus]|uniref:basigin isoform X2 n=1 Tax=Tympanuchus pallidicinctus TaxID=109042 RepID=UPI0022876E74|nr:basigin isoform X2 [Tympanuchus pallidicinctus]